MSAGAHPESERAGSYLPAPSALQHFTQYYNVLAGIQYRIASRLQLVVGAGS